MLYRKSNLRNRIVFILLIVFCILLITFYYKQSEEGVFQSTRRLAVSLLSSVQVGATKVFEPVKNGWHFLVGLGSARKENLALKQKLGRLKSKLNQYEAAAKENERLRKLVNLPLRKAYKTLAASVIGVSSNSWEDYITIDKGSNEGVKKNMPIVTSDGLVGRIAVASSRASVVQLITDSESGIAAEILGTAERGVIEGNLSGRLSFDFVEKTAKIEKGDIVVTSGLGGIFPKGLPVGRVSKVSSYPAAFYKGIDVVSDVDFTKLEEVLIILSPLPPDVSKLEKER